MAAIGRVKASLRVLGDSLEPEEVSALLGRSPSRMCRKGDPLAGKSGDQVEPTGAWILDSGVSEKAELEEHIEAMLSTLTNDTDEWDSLLARFTATVHCSLFLDRYNEGLELSPRVAQALSERGLVIAFDIYSGDADA